MRRSPSASLSLCNSSTLILCILIFSTLSFAAAPDRITGPIAGQLIKLSAGVSLKAQPGNDRGRVDSSLKLGYMTLLTVPSASQQKALNQLLSQQQDPRSPLYHMWLTPEQYADRFGLSPNDIQKLTAWLQSQGFTVVNVARGRNFIVFSGTAAQAETVFQTEIHNFDVGGETRFSNTTPPSIPAALSGVVTGIRGLNNFPAKSHAVHSKPNYTEGVGQYWIAPGDITTMYDLQKLYTAGINGSGQTLAVIGETDVYLADLSDFRSGFGLPAISGCTFFAGTNVIQTCDTTNFQYVVIQGDTDPGAPDSVQLGDLVEADIDLEWSNAVAPQAKIIYVNAPVSGVYYSMYYTIDQVLAPVMTMSYSFGCELGEAANGTLKADEAEFAQANIEGITFLNASGDNSAAACDPNTNGDRNDTLATGGLAVTYPASSPSVTGVGGTMIPWTEDTSTYWNNGTTGGSASEYIPEQGWNDAEEWGAYCIANPGDTTNCSGITSWATAQADTKVGILGGGGGASNCVTINDSGVCTGGQKQPAWQSGISASAINPNGFGVTTTPARYLPDVSLLASLFWPGFIACTPVEEIEGGSNTASICANGIAASLSDYGYKFGGTSFASPMFAGIVTLLNQYLNAGKGLGNINPTLYSLAATPANGVFHQLGSNAFSSTGSNGVYCDPGTPGAGWPAALLCPPAVKPATEGFFGYAASNFDPTTNYNLVTGLGSVDAYNLVHSWTSATTPSFTLSAASGSMTITPGGAGGTDIITLADVGGFTGDVSLAASGLPSGVTAGFSPNPTAGTTSTLTLTASGSAATGGPTTVTITGTSGSLTATTTVALTVSSTPSFTLSAVPSSLTIAAGGAGGASTITVTDVGGFTGTVSLAASGLPSGVTAGFSPNPTAGTTSTLTLTASGSAAAGGPTTVTITGTSGALTATTTVALTIVTVAPDFSVPATLTNPPAANPGQSTSTTMLISPVGGTTFANNVTYTCTAGMPTGISSCLFNQASPITAGSSATTVTVTIQTLGPFAGIAGAAVPSNERPRMRSQNQRLWLPLSLPLAGMLLVGLAGRRLPRSYKIVGLCLALAVTGFLVACGGGSSSTTTPVIGVTVSPSTVNTLYPNLTGAPAQTQQFSATVSNSTNQTVTWAVTGGSANGTIDPNNGLYTAPSSLPNPNSAITITATSAATTTPGTATVNLKTPTAAGTFPITVTVTEGSLPPKTTTFTLTVN
jgi:hypothetical protein